MWLAARRRPRRLRRRPTRSTSYGVAQRHLRGGRRARRLLAGVDAADRLGAPGSRAAPRALRLDGLRAACVVPDRASRWSRSALLLSTTSPASNALAVALAAATLAARRRRAWALTFRDNVPMLQRSRHEAVTDALTGLGNRRALMADLERALRRRRRRTVAARALRPRRLQALQRHLRPPGRRRAARSASARSSARAVDGARPRVPDGRRRVLRPARAAPAPRRRAIVAAAATALREQRRGLRDRRLVRRRPRCPRGRAPPPRRCRSPTSACTRTRPAGRRARASDDARRAAARPARARARAARPPRRRSPRSPARSARRSASSAEALDELARAAELHDIGKMAIPDAILDKPGPLDDERVGVHAPPHADRRARSSAPRRRSRRSRRLVRSSHERFDGSGLPGRARRRARSRSARGSSPSATPTTR